MARAPLSLEAVNPFQFDEPLAPYTAASREGRSISLDQVIRAWRRIRHEHAFFLVEGAGGLMAPMGKDYLAAHIAKAIGFPLLIVARTGLGTVNHTLLTIDYARRMGLPIAGVILNGLRNNGIAEKTNPALIERFSGVPVLGIVPWVKSRDREEIVKTIQHAVSIDRLLDAKEENDGH